VAGWVVALASGCTVGCESEGCCAAAPNDTSSAAANINFQVRMTLFSNFLRPMFRSIDEFRGPRALKPALQQKI
jgi:hypothetical protein